MPPVSQILRQTRERLGISLEDVAQRTYIKLPYLIALEEGDVSKLPAQVYIHGYIRQYAKLLDLPGSDLVLQYQQDASLRTTTTARIETRAITIPAPVGAAVGDAISLPGFATGPSSSMVPMSLNPADPARAETSQPRSLTPHRGAQDDISDSAPLSPAGAPGIELPIARMSEAVSRVPAAGALPVEASGQDPHPRSPEPVVRPAGREVELPVLGGTPATSSGLEMLEARKTAGEIIQSAQREAAEFRKAADVYADQVLGQLADEIGRTLQIVRNGKAFLQSRRKQRQADHA